MNSILNLKEHTKTGPPSTKIGYAAHLRSKLAELRSLRFRRLRPRRRDFSFWLTITALIILVIFNGWQIYRASATATRIIEQKMTISKIQGEIKKNDLLAPVRLLAEERKPLAPILGTVSQISEQLATPIQSGQLTTEGDSFLEAKASKQVWDKASEFLRQMVASPLAADVRAEDAQKISEQETTYLKFRISWQNQTPLLDVPTEVADQGAFSQTPDNKPPVPPTSLQAVGEAISPQLGKISLNWQPVSENDLAQYEIYFGTNSNEHYYLSSTTSTNYTFETAEINKRYYFGVKAVDKSGNQSELSNVTEAQAGDSQPPKPIKDLRIIEEVVPGNLPSSPPQKRISLIWEATNEPDFYRYLVYSGPNKDNLSLLVSTKEPNYQYYLPASLQTPTYSVLAEDTSGNLSLP